MGETVVVTDPSGSHVARRRGTTIAHVDLGPTVRRPTGEGGAPMPAREEAPMRPSDPPPSWKTITRIMPAVLVLVSSAVTGATMYATYTIRIDSVAAQQQETTEMLVRLEASSRARDEALAERLQHVERDVERDRAVRETESRSQTRAIETLADEIRELRNVVVGRRR